MAELPAAMQLVEPEAVDLMSADREDVEAIALLSAAISLKRIADAITGSNPHRFSDAAFNAGQAFEHGRRGGQ